MITDAAAAVGLVNREILTGSRDGRPTKIAIARRAYTTDPADLWDALTNEERLPRWFLPISGDLDVGGRYQFEGNAGGVVERCEAPRTFSVTWEYGPMVSWLTVTLTPGAGDTVLELRHEAHVDPDLWGQFGPGAVGVGWDLGLLGLGLHLGGAAPVDPAEAAAYPTTPEGAGFVQAAAEGWSQAAIADGDEPEAAQAAAANTVAMYTTPPPDGSEA